MPINDEYTVYQTCDAILHCAYKELIIPENASKALKILKICGILAAIMIYCYQGEQMYACNTS